MRMTSMQRKRRVGFCGCDDLNDAVAQSAARYPKKNAPACFQAGASSGDYSIAQQQPPPEQQAARTAQHASTALVTASGAAA